MYEGQTPLRYPARGLFHELDSVMEFGLHTFVIQSLQHVAWTRGRKRRHEHRHLSVHQTCTRLPRYCVAFSSQQSQL